ncbi:MAG: site-specific DNA-methyltransferase [Alphaproteobacteria bacterium]|nr:site-specific DNA-methyltransferase [Alphaproteobacteria bacterium]
MADDIQIQKMDGKSLDVTGVNKEKLKTVFPECFTEGNLDIDKLLSLCGEYIDNDFEKYKFEWKGKSECYRIAGKRSTGTLRPCPEESVDFENTNNLYIEGDNLEVLKLLQTAYYRKVKMIYIDPPYNTGNDFVYEDDFKDPMAKYKEITSQTTKSNPETMGRYHTNWLNMMYPRLRLASNLLRDDGVIFISIDDNEIDNLKKICNEVFGEENFIAQFIVASNSSKNNSKYVSVSHEYIICYAKKRDALTDEWKVKKNYADEFEKRAKQLTSQELSFDEIHNELLELVKYPRFYDFDHYTFADKKGVFRTDNSGGVTNGNFETEVIHPITKKPCVKPVGGWRYKDEEIKRLIENDMFYFGKDETVIPVPKRYLHDYMYQVPKSTLFFDSQSSTKWLKANNLPFDFAKAVDFIKYILSTSSKEDDIILDFFSGSATTAHAVMQLNAEDGGKRQFIMVQLPEVTDEKSEAFKAGYKNICEIGKERIRRAGAKIKEQNADVDVGFKVLKLDTSNLVKWDDTPVSETDVLRERFDSVVKTLKFDRSELDVVYEVMLKLGIPVTYKVAPIDINGRKVYSIGEDGLVLVCLDGSNGGITPEDISAMCDLTPAKIVAAEEAFKDDVALSNAYYISKDKGVEIELL